MLSFHLIFSSRTSVVLIVLVWENNHLKTSFGGPKSEELLEDPTYSKQKDFGCHNREAPKLCKPTPSKNQTRQFYLHKTSTCCKNFSHDQWKLYFYEMFIAYPPGPIKTESFHFMQWNTNTHTKAHTVQFHPHITYFYYNYFIFLLSHERNYLGLLLLQLKLHWDNNNFIIYTD